MALTPVDLLPPLRDVINENHLLARKSLGQHFLCDLNVTRQISEKAGDLEGCTVFEIGPGPGGLTRALVNSSAKKVIAIEKDRRCIAALSPLQAAAGSRLEVIEGDALKTDLLKLARLPRAIVANLPYNIGTELLLKWLKQIDGFRSLTLMFQEEVAQRITAAPGSKAYGRLSVISQFCCETERVMSLPASAFSPPPKVSSAVVRFTPRVARPEDVSIEALERVTAASFGQRRKMLRSSLASLGGETLLKEAGIEPTLRAENLTLQQFEHLARLSE